MQSFGGMLLPLNTPARFQGPSPKTFSPFGKRVPAADADSMVDCPPFSRAAFVEGELA